MSYAEAFFKDHFAALLNIEPQLLQNLQKKGRETTVDARYLVEDPLNTRWQIGFLIAEKYDFGTSKKINSIYLDSVGISPFSTKRARQYSQLVQDRNLLVHHGGIYTTAYARQRLNSEGSVFWDSLVINKDYFNDASNFVWDIAHKTMRSSRQAIEKKLETSKTTMSEEKKKAFGYLTYFMT